MVPLLIVSAWGVIFSMSVKGLSAPLAALSVAPRNESALRVL